MVLSQPPSPWPSCQCSGEPWRGAESLEGWLASQRLTPSEAFETYLRIVLGRAIPRLSCTASGMSFSEDTLRDVRDRVRHWVPMHS